jgi:hypothetical protein
VSVVASPHGAASATPRCFGAADRDPQRPCYNPALRLKVTPTPDDALLTPNQDCRTTTGGPGAADDTAAKCSYGAAAASAARTVAMIGDSHASHWRAAMNAMARAKRWRVVEFGTPHCPFSQALPDSGKAVAEWCPGFNGRILEWLGKHPEVSTVFFSSNANAPIVVPEGRRTFDYRTQKYVEEWRMMPASVKRIVVLRDDPIDRFSTFDCIRSATRRGIAPGPKCAVPRSYALPPDAQVAAAKLLADSRGGRVIDLSPFFCDRKLCYPVVGGVLVHKDDNHLGQLFALTLAPYIVRAYDALSWPA